MYVQLYLEAPGSESKAHLLQCSTILCSHSEDFRLELTFSSKKNIYVILMKKITHNTVTENIEVHLSAFQMFWILMMVVGWSLSGEGRRQP